MNVYERANKAIKEVISKRRPNSFQCKLNISKHFWKHSVHYRGWIRLISSCKLKPNQGEDWPSIIVSMPCLKIGTVQTIPHAHLRPDICMTLKYENASNQPIFNRVCLQCDNKYISSLLRYCLRKQKERYIWSSLGTICYFFICMRG